MAYSIELVVAFDKNRVIGKGDIIPWNLPTDRADFKKITIGHPIIVGSRTYFSFPEKWRPLPDRLNIIVSRKAHTLPDNPLVVVAHSLEHALRIAAEHTPDGKIFIIGGAQVYEQAMPYMNKMHISHIDAEVEGNVFFPDIPFDEWNNVETKEYPKEEYLKNEYSYRYVLYERKGPPPLFLLI